MKRLVASMSFLLGMANGLPAQDQHRICSLSAYLTTPGDSKLMAISNLARERNNSNVKKAILLSLKGVEIV